MESRHYKSVASNTVDRSSYTVTSGKRLQLTNVGGNAANSNAYIRVVWDRTGVNNIILVTYGDADQKIDNIELTGDGVKAIEIELINDTDTDVSIGGFWKGNEV